MGRLTAVVRAGAVSAVVALAGCGAEGTMEGRGYLKPPLAEPGLFPRTEPETEMSRLSEPVLPVVVEIPVPEPAAGGAETPGS